VALGRKFQTVFEKQTGAMTMGTAG
jgi:S-adenosylmethionine:tRNA-ribosyltransferase-isomerase (queuine synthetase)